MREDAQEGELQWKAIHQTKKHLYPNDSIDHPSKKSFRDDRMFFDQFREVIKSRSCSEISISVLGVSDLEFRTYGEGQEPKAQA